MLRENALISNIQLALLGIIMVVGVFYIWRGLSRLEDKLDALHQRLSAGSASPPSPFFGAGGHPPLSPFADDPVTEEEVEMADAFMKNVFGNMAFSAMSSGAAAATANGSGPVIVEETPSEPSVDQPAPTPAPAVAAPAVAAHTPAPAPPADDAETDAGNPLSRSKIRKMNADALRDACRAHGLPVDGTRAVLTERLLEKLYG